MHLSLLSLPLLAVLANAGRDTGRPGYGLVGYGITMYKPTCAYSCQKCFRRAPLECTDAASFSGSGMGGMNMGGMNMGGDGMPSNASTKPSPACYAANRPYLSSVAWCIHQKCTDVLDWKIEKFWQYYVVNNLPSDPPPSLSYGAALALVTSPPTKVVNNSVVLNTTYLANEKTYRPIYAALDSQEAVEVQHEQFGLVVLLSGVVIPVGFSLLRFVPFPRRWASALNGHFIYPSLLRPWRSSPISTVIGEPPTRGQALFIGYLIVLNIFLSAFEFSYHPEAFGYWWNNGPDEIMGDLANRLGILSFANFALLVLYSSRNNLLLWLTNWQHSTFVLLHRWVARIAVLQAILHSLVFLRDWIVQNRLATDQVLPYWWWGCIGTIAASLLLPFSIPILRQRSYEPFLVIHIVLAILVFLGSWYHIILRYQHQWGYETWLYIVFAVWGFDRLLRVLRVLRNGVRTAVVTPIDDDYIRIDVKGLVATGHVYLYFLHGRFWENHPFSVASSVVHQGDDHSRESEVSISDTEAHIVKPVQVEVNQLNKAVETGMVFYLRLLDGTTKALRNKTRVRVLIEGSYGNREDLSEYPTLVCIAGGVGVTACLPYMRSHPGNVYLYWGCRSQALVDSLKPMTRSFHTEAVVNKRVDIQAALEGQRGDFAIVVSGPASMMDEAREISSKLALKKRVKFIAESFTY